MNHYQERVCLQGHIIDSLVLAKVLDVTIGLRVSEDAEDAGLDLSLHAENAYAS